MAGERASATGDPGAAPVRRMRRAERREQILDAATRAFARAGYAATGLDDVAAEAGITRVILYRHFESKADMYRAVLDRACLRLIETVGVDDFDENAIPALLRAAAADPDGFRLLFHHAAREPEFRELTDSITAASRDTARRNLAKLIPSGPWLDWAAELIPTVSVEAVIAWLDAGTPDPATAADRISRAIDGVIRAARS
ncbi:TetR/AcrR family transcriptional regulator [Bailinhaonella thermotolerans]|uniref:TetR/AcrR family transcriptional regulator n=1 Tax=Bailinhaonella thermotolerans TaxID=1070861 RepID=A0A3A4B4G4_9ACTN|nr:TetR/AcrR family transcriptional regulator [Bailinhaonella thermotolerans]RJL35470.1 TetR/AcrR family transcriptional regulator [Bailinhaonella thermotolerans]